MDYKEKMKQGQIHCNVLIEILGKPKSYIEKVIKALVEKIKKEEKIEVINHKFAEPKEHEGYFTTFVEIEMVINNLNSLEEFIFAYLPSSIEILSPSTLSLSLNDATVLLNDLSARLHEYDDLLKKLKIANILMNKKLKELKPDISEKDFEFEDKESQEKK